jgi:hypothetical protein
LHIYEKSCAVRWRINGVSLYEVQLLKLLSLCLIGAPTYTVFQVLLVIFLLLSAYVGMLLFGKKTSEFKDYPTSLLNLMVLLTTANNPNVWAPAYTTNRWAFVFFFIFLVVGLFFLCNLAFMVIYSNYKVEVGSGVFHHQF